MIKYLLNIVLFFIAAGFSSYCGIKNTNSEADPFFINLKYNYFLNEIAVDFVSNSVDTIILQKPINNWNVSLNIYDKEDVFIFPDEITFVTFLVDSSFYIELIPNEKKSYKYLMKNFGYLELDKKQINKIQFRYVPQKTHMNQQYDNLVLIRVEKEIYVSHSRFITLGIIIFIPIITILLIIIYRKKLGLVRLRGTVL